MLYLAALALLGGLTVWLGAKLERKHVQPPLTTETQMAEVTHIPVHVSETEMRELGFYPMSDGSGRWAYDGNGGG